MSEPIDESAFEQLIAPLRGEMPDAPEIDENVRCLLTDGTVIRLAGVETDRLIFTLMSRGFATMKAADSKKITLFRHGVSAIITSTDDSEDEDD